MAACAVLILRFTHWCRRLSARFPRRSSSSPLPPASCRAAAFFPTFACQAGDKMCGTFDKLIHDFGPADATDYARTLVWCFIAGFAERLVPDKLKGLAAGAGER